jgi:hypothetical protein
MSFFVVLQEIVERWEDHPAAVEILHEIGFELRKVGRGMIGGRLHSAYEWRGALHHNAMP